MKRWVPVVLLGLLAAVVNGNEVKLDQDDDNRQRCSGMYSKKSWGGSVDPFILVKFLGDSKIPENEDPIASLIIFEWEDEELIGQYAPNSDQFANKETICSPQTAQEGLCKNEDVGSFILMPNATDLSKNPIRNQAIHLKDPGAPIQYPIRKTGYYCISTWAYSDHDYSAILEFRNSYGELPAAQIAKLPFYGGLTLVYAVLGVFWGFLYVQNRHDILPVQNYITATLIFLIIEQLMTWGYYDYQNRHGNNGLNKAFMVLVSILNAARNSLSFFLLLIVCMGYGVVKPTLGKTMIYVRVLAITHFAFGVVYAVASLSITPDSAGPLVLLVVLPLAATLTAFYVWTLSSLNLTMKDLADRKQKTKFMMYKKLWWCILGSIMVIFGFFFINSFAFAGRYSPDFVPDHWQTRWFILDGWLNLVYLFDIAFISYVWRPTVNNRRFAMSDELSQDDDGTFEFAPVGGDLSDDEDADGRYDPSPRRTADSDPEAAAARKLEERSVAPGGGASTSFTDQAYSGTPSTQTTTTVSIPRADSGGGVSRPPQPVRPRESLDGETIFAVGEGDEWSEADDSDGDEGRKLTRKISA